MQPSPTGRVIEHLRRAVLLRDEAACTDGQLLERFLRQRDAAAFAALVHRHASMVWGVCRRLLPMHQDAEDAFQATFVVLVRKASSITPRDQVGNWLHGVAQRIALSARAGLARRRSRERQVNAMPEPAAANGDSDELHAVLDLELSRLPAKYRAAIVLCDLGGHTRKEAADQLGIPEGTLSGHLSRGRSLLAKRLARHGLPVAGGMLAAAVAQPVLAAPSEMVTSAIEMATAGTAATVSARVVVLVEGVLKAMLLTKLKKVMAIVVAIAVVGTGLGVGWFSQATRADDNGVEAAQAQPPAQKKAVDPPARDKGGDFLVFRLKNGEAVAMAKTLEDLLSGGADGELRIVADPRSNSLLIRGTEGQIARVKELVIRLDEMQRDSPDLDRGPGAQPPKKAPAKAKGELPKDDRIETMLFALKEAQASDMAKTLRDLLEVKSADHLRIAADPGSNSVVVRARRDEIADIEALIQRLEIATRERLERERRLQGVQQEEERLRQRALEVEAAKSRPPGPSATVTVRQGKRMIKLPAGLTTNLEGLSLALLGSCRVESNVTREQWEEALRTAHLRIAYAQPRSVGVSTGEGEHVLGLSEVLLPLASGAAPFPRILVRSAEKYHGFTKYDPREAQLLFDRVQDLQKEASALEGPPR
jgi:RNA polymerase sigma factor (sigma-70 family)